jgi:hypothetical protein
LRNRRPRSAPCRARRPRQSARPLARRVTAHGRRMQFTKARLRESSACIPAPSGLPEGYSAKEGRHAISRQGSRTTQTEMPRQYSRHEIAIFQGAASSARFVLRAPKNPT